MSIAEDSSLDRSYVAQIRNSARERGQSDPMPPVFVMNLYYTGIGIARSLRDHGVEVIGLSSEADATGMRSRDFTVIHRVPNSRDAPEALCKRLVEMGSKRTDRPLIFPTRDADILFLRNYERKLASHYRLPHSLSEIERLTDKLQLAKIAVANGIATPRTAACASEAEVEEVSKLFTFPLVMKPRNAHEWRRLGVWQAVGGRKAIQARTLEKLVEEYRGVRESSPEVLIQEYVSGADADIVVCCCYIAADGRMLGHFTGRKLLQSPPLFGTGCIVEAVEVPDIVESTQRLLRACGYSGMAEVEFKRDATSGLHQLIEVNPRHWDQHALGLSAGINLSWIAYRDLIGADFEPAMPSYRNPATRWVAEREALLHVLRMLFTPRDARPEASASIAQTLGMLRGRRTFAVLDRRDLMPGAVLARRLFSEIVGTAARKLSRR